MSRPKNRRIDRPAQAGEPAPVGAYIPIKSARMCADCDAIFGKGHVACPRCGSTEWFFVSNFVPSVNGDEEEQAVRASYRPDHSPIGTVGEVMIDKDEAFMARIRSIRFESKFTPSRPLIARVWARVSSRLRPRTEIAL